MQQNELKPFAIDIRKYLYGTVVVYAPDEDTAVSAVEKMLFNEDPRLLFQEGDFEAYPAYIGDDEWDSNWVSIYCE